MHKSNNGITVYQFDHLVPVRHNDFGQLKPITTVASTNFRLGESLAQVMNHIRKRGNGSDALV